MEPSYAVLVTRGRRTGRPHAVRLRVVVYEGSMYFSRHRPDGDWFKNALADPSVEVRYDGRTIRGRASVADSRVSRIVSELKYPGEGRARERRVAIRVMPEPLS
ncbi:MAG: DUF385 domain-containing protein [Nitrosopumilus sp. H8]|nr:MAG: DUF385 domain-containing protein [Nitrosopumilus sp. H13]RNJ77832.1 MAG: DUF385 domain-containing protein [Nitrosopumilus sp. H8]